MPSHVIVEIDERPFALIDDPGSPLIELIVGIAAAVSAGRTVEPDVDKTRHGLTRRFRSPHVMKTHRHVVSIERTHHLVCVPTRMTELDRMLEAARRRQCIKKCS